MWLHPYSQQVCFPESKVTGWTLVLSQPQDTTQLWRKPSLQSSELFLSSHIWQVLPEGRFYLKGSSWILSPFGVCFKERSFTAFHILPSRCFVAACYLFCCCCSIPPGFQLSDSSTLLYFGALGGQVKRWWNLGWQVIHRREHHPLDFIADQLREQGWDAFLLLCFITLVR